MPDADHRRPEHKRAAQDMDLELRRAQQEVQRLTAELEEANQTKSDFLARMSHELRTPMNAILGYSEMLQEEAAERGLDSFLGDLQKIETAGRHLLSLINDVLELSKIEAQSISLYFVDFDVRNLLGDLVEAVQPLMARRFNTFTSRCPEDIGSMHSDMVKVRHCLFNLLSNACKATKSGTVSLEARREAREGRDWIRFRVTDSGIGMTAEEADAAFEAFAQAGSAPIGEYGGGGLSLPLTKKLCEILGGEIRIESTLGEGTTVTMDIPMQLGSRPRPETRSEAPAGAPAQRDGKTVLVIDDDPIVHELVTRMLTREGFGVVTASSGEEGLRLAREVHPIAITLDVVMPRMDGWAVLTALKDDPATADIPVIMVSMLDDHEVGFGLGVSEYLTKPIPRDRLVAAVAKYRSRAGPGHVLIVEDEPSTRELMTRVLRSEGWTVAEAENGRVALERLEEQQPDLILLDLMMPEMDGFEVVRALQQHSEWRSIPTLVLTARDLTSRDRERLSGHVKAILQKGPNSHQEVLTEITDLMQAVAEQASGRP